MVFKKDWVLVEKILSSMTEGIICCQKIRKTKPIQNEGKASNCE